jgi:hypothetical protein
MALHTSHLGSAFASPLCGSRRIQVLDGKSSKNAPRRFSRFDSSIRVKVNRFTIRYSFFGSLGTVKTSNRSREALKSTAYRNGNFGGKIRPYKAKMETAVNEGYILR